MATQHQEGTTWALTGKTTFWGLGGSSGGQRERESVCGTRLRAGITPCAGAVRDGGKGRSVKSGRKMGPVSSSYPFE